MPTPASGQIAKNSPDTHAKCQVQPGTVQGPRRRRLSKTAPKLPPTQEDVQAKHAPELAMAIHGVRTYQAKVTKHQHKPRKLRGRFKRNRAQTEPNLANCEDVSSETVPKPSQTRAKPSKL